MNQGQGAVTNAEEEIRQVHVVVIVDIQTGGAFWGAQEDRAAAAAVVRQAGNIRREQKPDQVLDLTFAADPGENRIRGQAFQSSHRLSEPIQRGT